MGAFIGSKNTISMLPEKIVKSSTGNLKRTMAHEFGHLCHQARVGKNELERRHNTESHETVKPLYQRMMEKDIGPKATQCIMNALEKRYSEVAALGIKRSLPRWYEESRADTLFAKEYDNQGYSFKCNTLEDFWHSSVRTYLHCYSLIPDVQSSMCPKSGSKSKPAQLKILESDKSGSIQ